MMNLTAKLLLAGCFALAFHSATHAQNSYNPTLLDDEMSIIENAAKVPELSIFVEALMASELADELMRDGPFTVFAPSNEAFNELPGDTLPELMRPDNADQLAEILRVHISRSPLRAADLEAVTAHGSTYDSGDNSAEVTAESAPNTTYGNEVKGGAVTVETLNEGNFLVIDEIGGQLYLQPALGDEERAAITIPDIIAENGIIHVINRVMTP